MGVKVLIAEREFSLSIISVLNVNSRQKVTHPNTLPLCDIPAQIHASLTDSDLGDHWTSITLIPGKPASLDLVIPPLASMQFLRNKLLHHVSRHAVEDVEERFLAE